MLPPPLHLRRALGPVLLSALAAFAAPGLLSQTPATAPATASDNAITLDRVTSLREAFISRVHATGHSCPIAPPVIVVTHIPSFGHFDGEKNTLYTADWARLDPEEKAVFVRLAGPGADDAAVHSTFEDIAHRWIFVHELGHWWQACNHLGGSSGRPPYAVEYEANRIAMAYWREVDPALAKRMGGIGQDALEHLPDPTPKGQDTIAYFNTNYQQLGPTPAYRWYQARMIAETYSETPPPTFAQSLDLAKH